MPSRTLEREVNGSTAFFRICGKFDGACAWELAGRLEREALQEVVVDFSQVSEFVDYGIAVITSALISSSPRQVQLQGLRRHQERLFKYFGVDPALPPGRRPPAPRLPDGPPEGVAKEVA
jgi:anti-anti-sigma regulatory factor